MKSRPQVLQQLVSFTNSPKDLDQIDAQISNGWNMVSLTQNANCYVGIMEKQSHTCQHKEDTVVFIPPRKKIKILK